MSTLLESHARVWLWSVPHDSRPTLHGSTGGPVSSPLQGQEASGPRPKYVDDGKRDPDLYDVSEQVSKFFTNK